MTSALRGFERVLVGAVLLVACAGGGGARETRPAPPAGDAAAAPPVQPDPTAPGEEERERTAAEKLAAARLAYEAAALREALEFADEVIRDFEGTTSAAEALRVGAKAAFGLGRYERARSLADAYLRTDPVQTSAQEARALEQLARDALETPSETARIGAILPRTGSRILVQYADWVLEGIRLAVAEFEERYGRDIELLIADDASGARTADAIAELEAAGVLVILGPLLPQQLPAAAGARAHDGATVLITPTIPEPGTFPRVYSVAGGDTRGAQELGAYAAQAGLMQAALLYPRSPEHEKKAQAFAVEYEAAGGKIMASVPYDSGTTTFGAPMRRILQAVAPVDTTVTDSLLGLPLDSLIWPDSVIALDSLIPTPVPYEQDPWQGRPAQPPFALFVPAPDRDVRQIAPQISFYGLDSAGVQVFGDEAWASSVVRRVVPARDLEGVIASSSLPPDRAGGLADPDFVRRYEQTYRRSLGDNALPALGYDVALLALHALPSRAMNADAVARRLEFQAGIHGATGILSIRGGRVVRTPFLVVIRQGGLRPVPFPWDYVLPVPKPPAPPDTSGSTVRR